MIRNAVISFFNNVKESLTLNSLKLDKDNRLFRRYNILSFLLTFSGIVSFFVILVLSIINQGLFPDLNEFAIDKYYNVFMVTFVIIIILLILMVLRVDRKRYDPINRKELWALFLLILAVIAISIFGFVCYNDRILHLENDFIWLISFGNPLHPEKALVTYICISLFSAIIAYWIFDDEKSEEPFELLSLIINTVFVIPFILLMVTNLKNNILYIIILILFLLILSLIIEEDTTDNKKVIISEPVKVVRKKERKYKKSEIVKNYDDDDIEKFYFAKGSKLQIVENVLNGKDYIFRDKIYEVCSLEDFKNGKVEIYINRKRIRKITK